MRENKMEIYRMQRRDSKAAYLRGVFGEHYSF